MKGRPVLLGFIVGSAVIIVFFLASLAALSSFSVSPKSLLAKDGIGLVEIESTITDSRETLEELQRYAEDDSIRAILIRIDSPGGGVGPSQEIYREILKIRGSKPVVASLGGTAASGGYYVASAASKIMANPGTLTGSIGVIMEFMNIKRLYEYAGVSNTVIKSGEFKDMGSSSRDLTKKESELLQDVVDDVQRQFVQAIADGRGLDAKDIAAIADGRIFTGAHAKELKLVDELGNFNDAVDYTARLVGIKGKPRLVRPRQKRISLLDYFLDDLTSKFMGRLEGVRNGLLPEFRFH